MGSQIRLLAFGFIFEVKLEVEEGAFPAKSRHYYPPPPTTGTCEALMERRAAPYPYSKMCELCELCELLERKIPPLSRWDFLIYPQQNLFVGRGVFRRRFCFRRVVRLLQRAEEGCEGLKHGYYDLPCVHFLIFLCHDI